MQVTNGNAGLDGRDFGYWFLGDLQRWAGRLDAPDFGLRQSSAVEMKWGMHRKGETRASWAACSEKRTLSLLASGKFLIQFRSPDARERVQETRLQQPGDYAVWGTDLEHSWIVEEEAVILTVRWHERRTL
jgi:hypothetical protein